MRGYLSIGLVQAASGSNFGKPISDFPLFTRDKQHLFEMNSIFHH